MNKVTLTLLAACSIPLAGCTGMGGMGGPGVLGSVLGSVLDSGGQRGMGGADFQTMAIDACGAEASRYGQARISEVRAASRSTLRVYGTIDANYQRHSFACDYREDGRITGFDVR